MGFDLMLTSWAYHAAKHYAAVAYDDSLFFASLPSAHDRFVEMVNIRESLRKEISRLASSKVN